MDTQVAASRAEYLATERAIVASGRYSSAATVRAVLADEVAQMVEQGHSTAGAWVMAARFLRERIGRSNGARADRVGGYVERCTEARPCMVCNRARCS